jgi:hypothetical protein
VLSAISARVHVYEVRPRKDKRGFDLISDALPFGRLWYAEPDAVGNAVATWTIPPASLSKPKWLRGSPV